LNTAVIERPLFRGPIAFLAGVLFAAILQPVAFGQSDSLSSIGQWFGRFAIRLGMPEHEAVRNLREEFTLKPVSGVTGAFLIARKDDPDQIVGAISSENGAVAMVQSEWTPRVNRAGAFADNLFTLLARLSFTGKRTGQWRVAELCSIGTVDGASTGPDTQVRIAEIQCGAQRVSLTVSRTDDAGSQAQLSFVTRR
jgi:hypothetical protein